MRCYNGCPDSVLQAKLDADALIRKRLNHMGMRATYFPMEQKYMVFHGLSPVTKFHSTLQEAANAVGEV